MDAAAADAAHRHRGASIPDDADAAAAVRRDAPAVPPLNLPLANAAPPLNLPPTAGAAAPRDNPPPPPLNFAHFADFAMDEPSLRVSHTESSTARQPPVPSRQFEAVVADNLDLALQPPAAAADDCYCCSTASANGGDLAGLDCDWALSRRCVAVAVASGRWCSCPSGVADDASCLDARADDVGKRTRWKKWRPGDRSNRHRSLGNERATGDDGATRRFPLDRRRRCRDDPVVVGCGGGGPHPLSSRC